MIKEEYIKRHGIEAYEAHKAKIREYLKNPKHKEACKIRNRERYQTDLEYREAYNSKRRRRLKERYQADTEYREHRINTSRNYSRERYCRQGELELIENYELAKADNFKGWVIHHRLELTLNGEFANSVEDLKRMNMYYNRPYFELIYLTKSEHAKLHYSNLLFKG